MTEAGTVSSGGVLSTLTVYGPLLPVLPARSVQVALKTSVPSPAEVLLVVQLPGSTPEPLPSDQFQLTVTSALFQPLPFGSGLWVGLATGGVVSSPPPPVETVSVSCPM